MKGRFLKKILSVTMALAMTAGAVCISAVTARGAEVDVVPLNAVQKLTNNSTISSTLISKGETLTVNAQAGGGQGGYTYAVLYRKKTDKDWTVRQGYKDNATIIVKPAKDTDYDVCVKVKDKSGELQKVYDKFNVSKVSPLTNTSVLAKSSVNLGEYATVKCSSTGGIAPYQYAVYYKKKTDTNWMTKQSFSENTTVTFKPLKALTYNVCVKAKDKNNTVDKKYFTLNVTQPISNLSLSAYLASSNINKGDTAVAICSAKDGIEPYKYALYAKKSTSSYWSTIQDFNSNSVITYKPTDTGNYDICVKVKDSSGKADKQYLTVTVK